ncbi:MAG: amidohydrolase [Infirmifilum sp.]
MKILIKNPRVVVTQDPGRGILRGESIYIEDSIIKAVAPLERLAGYDFDLEIDGRDMAVIPGLVNLHTHATQIIARGLFDDYPLMSWLYRMDRFYEGMDDEAARAAARLAFIEGVLCGTTTFLDMEVQANQVIEAALEVGVRLFEAVALVDTVETGPSGFPRTGDPEEVVEKAVQLALKFRNHPLVRVGLGPVGFPSSSPELLRLASQAARENNLFIHTHLSESRVNERLARKFYGVSETLLLEKLGVLSPRLVAAHAVNVSALDIDTLAKHGVSVAHCPSSNAKLANGIAPALRMISRGLNVGLGTDGAASNNTMDMFQEMRVFTLMQRALSRETLASAQQALDAATVNGARALGLEDRLGVVKPGAYADLVLLDLKAPFMEPPANTVGNLVFSGACRAVKNVIVAGRLLVYDGVPADEELAARAVESFEEHFDGLQNRLY